MLRSLSLQQAIPVNPGNGAQTLGPGRVVDLAEQWGWAHIPAYIQAVFRTSLADPPRDPHESSDVSRKLTSWLWEHTKSPFCTYQVHEEGT